MKFLDGIDLASQQIKHVADGSSTDDGATWGQVQSLLAGLEWKAAVVAASTAQVSITSAPSSVDGVTLAANDRVLLKNQTAGSENGIYVFSVAAAAMVRSTDMDSSLEFNNATTLVLGGTTNADTAWTQTAKSPTVGTTTITFVSFGGGAIYTNGNGLNLSGGTFSVKIPGSGVVGLVVDGTGVYIDATVVVRKFAANVGDGTSTSIAVTHNLGTRDVTVDLHLAATPWSFVLTDWVATDTNNVTFAFAVAPTTNQYRAVIHG